MTNNNQRNQRNQRNQQNQQNQQFNNQNNKNNQNNQNNQNNPLANEEFGSETDVQHVKQQNQKAEAKKQQASGPRANRNGDQTK